MWDSLFGRLVPEVASSLACCDGGRAWESMHGLLDESWQDLSRRTVPGGIACINVGDATRTIGESFRVFPNHVRISAAMARNGMVPLPEIIWSKTSNKPTKFMGSGMLPPGAYVTQEHEYILIFRKGGKKVIQKGSEARARSAYFWEERNSWFSDIWDDLRGERQDMVAARARSASFPLELPYRLISMFSLQGDLVFDPFLGTGTTALAAMATGRNSISSEIDPSLEPVVRKRLLAAVETSNRFNLARLERHAKFASSTPGLGYRNEIYGFPVMTRQETELLVPKLSSVEEVREGVFEVDYSEEPFSLRMPG